MTDYLPVFDRFTGDVIDHVPADPPELLPERFRLARAAIPALRKMGPDGRLDVVLAFAEALEAHRDEFVGLMVNESGQARKFATWEFEHVLDMARGFGELIDLIRPREIPAVSGRNLMLREPCGVVAILTSSNSPLWAPFVAVASSFGGANGTIFRPATTTRRSSLHLVDLFLQAGAPLDSIQMTTAGAEDVLRAAISGADAVVPFSGSEKGKENMLLLADELSATRRERSGRHRLVGNLVKYIPEMAGNDPFLVIPGADIREASTTAALAAFANAGQLCMSAKRFIVHEDLAEGFIGGLEREASELVVGDPRDPATDIGPLFREATRRQAALQLREALEGHGELLFGGRHEGEYFWPTLIKFPREALLDTPPLLRPALWMEESFAPLRSLVTYRKEEEAIQLANESYYGLGASIFGEREAALRIAERLEAGRVIIDEGPFYQDAHLPVGGIKDSGMYGSAFKIEQLTNPKRVHLGA